MGIHFTFTLARHLTDGEKKYGKTQLQSKNVGFFFMFQIMKNNFVSGMFFKEHNYLYLSLYLLIT